MASASAQQALLAMMMEGKMDDFYFDEGMGDFDDEANLEMMMGRGPAGKDDRSAIEKLAAHRDFFNDFDDDFDDDDLD